MGRITLFLLVFVLIGSLAKGQLLVENFDYGASDNSNINSVASNWTWVNSGTEGPGYSATGLTFHNSYPSQGIGGAMRIVNSKTKDAHISLGTPNSNSQDYYISFLLRCEFIFSEGFETTLLALTQSSSTSTFKSAVVLNANSGLNTYQIGFKSNSSASTVYESTNFSLNTTYCIVVYYKFSPLFADYGTLFVFNALSDIPASMPSFVGSEKSQSLNESDDPTEISNLVIQSGAYTPTGYIDGIRVGTTWAQAPLPVELTSFTAKANGNAITLNWSTATEVENYGFEIERASLNGEFQKIGFVAGAGNSNATKDYTYTDTKLATGKYQYRLKQIDNSGTFEYSNIIQTEILPTKFELKQNYPNPFNPSTTISFAIAEGSQTRLEILNPLGESVATLVDGNLHAGTHVYQWDGTHSPSGVYMARLITPTQSKTIRMLLVK